MRLQHRTCYVSLTDDYGCRPLHVVVFPRPVADIQCLEPTPNGGNPSARAKHMVLRLSKQGSYQVLFRGQEASPTELCDSKQPP